MRRKVVIFAIAVVAGIINAAVIFNAMHRNDYVDEIVSVTQAMSESTKTFVVDNDADYDNFSARAEGFTVYKFDSLPDEVESVWVVYTQNSQQPEKSTEELLPNYHQISEVIKERYSAFELEKL